MNSSVLDGITLESGAHKTRANGVCAMEAVAWLAGENHTDHPKCACPVIAQLVRAWNDSLPDEDRQRLLKPLLPLLVGSKSTPGVEMQRAYMALDWLVRTHTAAWLRVAKLTDDADAIEGLPAITDLKTAKAAGVVVRAAEKRVDDVWDAAKAAMAAAGDAAETAAEAAAWGTAAGAAAGNAVRIATENAAWAAAKDALRPTVTELQNSCAELIQRMAAIR